MNYSYLCPKCKGQLEVGGNIIFSVKTEKGNQGLILLKPEIGDYTVITNPTFKFKKGESVEFFCPVCHQKLSSEINGNLIEILMIDENKKEHRIIFSKIAGEKSSYKITGKYLEVFGDEASHYIEFFNKYIRIN